MTAFNELSKLQKYEDVLVGSSRVQKIQKQSFAGGGWSKKFEDWGGGGIKILRLRITFSGGSVPHYMPCNY